MEKNNLSKSSSLLVSVPALCLWAALTVVSAAAGYIMMAGLFLFFLLLFSFVRYWAARAMAGVSLEVACSACSIYPGMDTELEYKIKNDKLLPLPWLELSQQAPDKDCLVPDDSFEAYSYQKDTEDRVLEVAAFKRGFSLVMGYESMSLSSSWHAQCRGIYRPDELLLRSGDGFGLSQEEKRYPAQLVPEIVVYPSKVAVESRSILRQDWDKSYGALGHVEDMSVLRGLRPYSNADSWKRINWRMAARQPNELSVNFYETVQPSSILFIFDGESYCKDTAALEDSLEVLASLITELVAKSVSCGLCMPESRRFSAVNISHERQPAAAELLYYLAGFDCLRDPVPDKDNRPSGEYYPSVFELNELGRSALEAGTVALFTHSPAELSTRLLERLDSSRLIVVSSGGLDCKDKQLRMMHISVLRKGDGK